MADYSSLVSLPIIPGRPFYAPQVVQYKGFFISKYIAGTSGEDVSWEPRTVGNPPLLAQITWYRDQSDLVLCWYIINWNLPVF